jgi:hypothetical protein
METQSIVTVAEAEVKRAAEATTVSMFCIFIEGKGMNQGMKWGFRKLNSGSVSIYLPIARRNVCLLKKIRPSDGSSCLN